MTSGEPTGALLRASARLRPRSDATTVQVRDGKVLISDGPFAEIKEQIGGYCLIERTSTKRSKSLLRYPARGPEPSRYGPSGSWRCNAAPSR
jgi:hypothetical protein